MYEHPYYPSDLQQDVALREYDKQVSELLEYIREAFRQGQMTETVCNRLINTIIALEPGDNIMKYRLTIPVGQTRTTTNSKNQLVGVPDLGEATHAIMNQEELDDWFKMWEASNDADPFIIIEKLVR